MSPIPEILSVEVPASLLLDPSLFEIERAAAYEITDPMARTERLSQVIGSAALIDREGSLSDAVLELITSPEAASAKDYATRARGIFEMVSKEAAKRERRFRIEVDQNGEPVGLFRIDPIAEDKRATEKGHKISINTPSGPKQNDSSFRINGRGV